MDNKYPIIRKLGPSEALYTNLIRNGSFINIRAALVGSKIDLYADVNKLYKAISYWKQSHHFLRANIVTNEKGEYSFAYAPKDIADDTRNICLLKLDRRSNRDTADTWQLFVERELIKPIGIEALLWRLFFIQIENDKNDNTFQYYLIFNPSHAIHDGPNAFHVIMHLMQIIEKTYFGEHVEILSYDVVPALDQHPEVLEYKKKIETDKMDAWPDEIVKIPAGFISDHYPNPPPVDYSKRCEDVFLTHDNQLYATYNDILEESKNFHSKAVGFIVDPVTFGKLLTKCKMHDLKLTGCLNMIAVIAFQKIAKRFDGKEYPIPYLTPLTIRTRLNPPIETIRMGYCTAFLIDLFNEYYNVEENGFWSTKFWQLAKKESDSIHLKLKKREFLWKLAHDKEMAEKFATMDSLPENTISYHITFSNRGDLNKFSMTESKSIWMKESYTGCGLGRDNKFSTFIFLVESINNALFCSITYNHNLIKPEVGQAYESEFKDAIYNLTN